VGDFNCKDVYIPYVFIKLYLFKENFKLKHVLNFNNILKNKRYLVKDMKT